MALNVLVAVRAQFEALWRTRQFNATVVSVSGENQISVSRTGHVETEGPYAAAEGLTALVSVGDRVKVEYVNGAYQVAYKLGAHA